MRRSLADRESSRAGFSGPMQIRDTSLVRNPAGLRRLCAWLGLPTDGEPWALAYRYLRWCKRNPQPRVDRR